MGEQLTILDTMFLELEQVDETAHMHIGAALIFDELPDGGAPDIDELREYMGARIGLLPRFAQQLSAPAAGPLTWLTWEPTPDFDISAHLRHASLPAPGGERELQEWLGDFWSHRLDRHRPLWEIVLLDGLEGGRWAMATKTHHCLVDGVGALDLGKVLLDETPDAQPVPEQPLEPVHGENGGGRSWFSPGLAIRGARAGLSALTHPRDSIERIVAAAEVIVKEEIIAAPESSLNRPTSGTRHYATVRLSLDDVNATRERYGGTINDMVLALCAGGLRHLLESRGEQVEGVLRAQVPVNIRTAEGRDLGNEITSLFIELPVGEPDALRRYRRVVDNAEHLKASSQGAGGSTIAKIADLAPPLAGELLARSMFGTTRMFNLTITNVPGPPDKRYAFGAPLVEVLPLVPLFTGHTVGIAAVSYAGQMVFGINADRVAAPDVAVLAEGIERSFAELSAPVPAD